MIELGTRVRDTLSGIEGVAVSRHDYMWGCARYGVQADGEKEGKPFEPFVVDEPQLEIVNTAAFKGPAERPETGGPQADPSRPAPPAR